MYQTKPEKRFVYGIQSARSVKIRFCRYPNIRLREIQVHNPNKCEIKFLAQGDVKLEREIQRALSFCKAQGEWFQI